MRAFAAVLLAGCSGDRVHDHLFVATEDAVLPVAVHGNVASGTLVLFESGGPSGPSIAQRAVGLMPFRDTLEPELAVASYDRRGTGNATGDYVEADLSLEQLLRDLDAVVATLQVVYAPERLVLLSHSFGTYTAGAYQLDHPGVVDGWVAAAPAFIEGPDELYLQYRRDYACRVAGGQLDAGDDEALWVEILAYCDANPTLEPVWESPERVQLWEYLDVIEDRLEPWPAYDPAGLLVAVFGSHYNVIDSQLTENRISRNISAEPGREDLLPEVGQLEIPVAVTTGEYDGTTPTEMGAALAAAIGPRATLTEFPGAGHYMMVDDPEGFADVVSALVDEL